MCEPRFYDIFLDFISDLGVMSSYAEVCLIMSLEDLSIGSFSELISD